MTTTIAPSLGNNVLFTQGGVGGAPGYDAVDVRRQSTNGVEGTRGPGAWAVGPRAAGANMSVDIAANLGYAYVQGDSVAEQGVYTVPPHSAIINEAIAAAHPTLPRLDLVVLEVLDNQYDGSGLSIARTRVLTGTPAASPPAPSVPPSCLPLSYVIVQAAATSITATGTSSCQDCRPKTRGKSIITAAETRTSTTYGMMPTPDVVRSIVLPTDGLMFIGFQGQWQSSDNQGVSAAIFLNGNQLRLAAQGGSPAVQEAFLGGVGGFMQGLSTSQRGLVQVSGDAVGSSSGADVTTGQVLGVVQPSSGVQAGTVCVFAAAGWYDVSVQFKKGVSGTLTVQNRKLWVWTMAPDQGVAA